MGGHTAICFFAVLLLAGCTTGPGPTTSTTTLTASGITYAEGAGAAERLLAKVEMVIAMPGSPCPHHRPPGEPDPVVFLEINQRLWNDCDWNHWDQAKAETQRLKTDEERRQKFWQTMAQANQSLAAEVETISAVTPGSIPDAEFLSTLMRTSDFHRAQLQTAMRVMWHYEGEPRDLTYETALVNALGPIQAAPHMAFIVRHYPWDKGTCRLDSPAQVEQTFEETVAAALRAAERHAEAHNGEVLNSPLGQIKLGRMPEYAFYKANGWHEGILFRQSQLDWYLHYFEIYGSEKPTYEESIALVRQYENTTLSFPTDFFLDTDLREPMGYRGPWERTDRGAYLAKALPAMRWHFDQFDCS